jgi:hypothetical protein
LGELTFEPVELTFEPVELTFEALADILTARMTAYEQDLAIKPELRSERDQGRNDGLAAAWLAHQHQVVSA